MSSSQPYVIESVVLFPFFQKCLLSGRRSQVCSSVEIRSILAKTTILWWINRKVIVATTHINEQITCCFDVDAPFSTLLLFIKMTWSFNTCTVPRSLITIQNHTFNICDYVLPLKYTDSCTNFMYELKQIVTVKLSHISQIIPRTKWTNNERHSLLNQVFA